MGNNKEKERLDKTKTLKKKRKQVHLPLLMIKVYTHWWQENNDKERDKSGFETGYTPQPYSISYCRSVCCTLLWENKWYKIVGLGS